MKGQINIYQKSEKPECKAVKQPFSLTSVYFKCLCNSLSNLSEKLLICLTTDKSIEKVLNFRKCAIRKKIILFFPPNPQDTNKLCRVKYFCLVLCQLVFHLSYYILNVSWVCSGK